MLPPELQFRALGLVDIERRETLLVCSTVCKAWAHVAQQRLFQQVVLRDIPSCIRLADLLKTHPRLSSLIKRVSVWESQTAALLFDHGNLREAGRVFVAQLAKLPNLIHLDLEICLFLDGYTETCVNMFQTPRITALNLELLNISHVAFVELIRSCQMLEHLAILSITFTDGDDFRDPGPLADHTPPKILSLTYHLGVNPAVGAYLLSPLFILSSVHTLSFYWREDLEISHFVTDMLDRLLGNFSQSLRNLNLHFDPDFSGSEDKMLSTWIRNKAILARFVNLERLYIFSMDMSSTAKVVTQLRLGLILRTLKSPRLWSVQLQLPIRNRPLKSLEKEERREWTDLDDALSDKTKLPGLRRCIIIYLEKATYPYDYDDGSDNWRGYGPEIVRDWLPNLSAAGKLERIDREKMVRKGYRPLDPYEFL